MSEQTAPSKKITVGLTLGWIFGILFALVGIVSVFSEPIPGLVMLIMAAVLLPPVIKWVDQKWKFHLSGGMKIIVVIIGLIIFGATIGTSKVSTTQKSEPQKEEQQIIQDENVSNKTVTEPVNEEQPQTEINEQKDIETEPVPVSSETVSQKNAVAKAKSYLSYSAFSHDGLVEQLEYEQFPHADAVYGADNCGADWNEQALKKAKSYLSYSAFSHDGLVEQLKYDKFTQAQAEYGADNCGADWDEQAAKKAKSYMEYSAFSRGSLIEQLKYDGFTQAQAEYGADSVGL